MIRWANTPFPMMPIAASRRHVRSSSRSAGSGARATDHSRCLHQESRSAANVALGRLDARGGAVIQAADEI